MKTETIVIKKDHSFGTCPSCGVIGKLRKSRAKNSFEQSTKLGMWRYYRCKECGWRGRKFSFKLSKVPLKTILLYIFLMIATAVVVRFIIQKFAMK